MHVCTKLSGVGGGWDVAMLLLWFPVGLPGKCCVVARVFWVVAFLPKSKELSLKMHYIVLISAILCRI